MRSLTPVQLVIHIWMYRYENFVERAVPQAKAEKKQESPYRLCSAIVPVPFSASEGEKRKQGGTKGNDSNHGTSEYHGHSMSSKSDEDTSGGPLYPWESLWQKFLKLAVLRLAGRERET